MSAVVWSVSLQDGFGKMLLNPLLQTLGSTTHVSIVTAAQKLVENVHMVGSRSTSLLVADRSCLVV